MLKDIFNRLSEYLVFENETDRENEYRKFENDIICNGGLETLETVETLLNNNEILAFPHFDDLTKIKQDVKHAVFMVTEYNKNNFVKGF